jgi:hypothetical protein
MCHVGGGDKTIDEIKVAEVLLVGVSIGATVRSDIQPGKKIDAGAIGGVQNKPLSPVAGLHVDSKDTADRIVFARLKDEDFVSLLNRHFLRLWPANLHRCRQEPLS